jgi:hypothetical protein
MIKKIFLLSIVLLLFACSNDEPVVNSVQTSNAIEENDSANFISEEDALKDAISFLNVSDKNPQISMMGSANQNAKPAVVLREVLTSKVCRDYYIFNFKNDRGFAVVSSDKRDSVRVFVACTEGNISEEIWNDEQNGLGYLKNLVEQYHANAIKSSRNDNSSKQPRRDPVGNLDHRVIDDTVYSYGPLMSTRWSQGGYINQRPDSCPLGCWPVAIGQVMAYHQHPQSVTFNNNTYTFDWNKIGAINTEYDAFWYPAGANEVFKLLSAIGLCGNVQYTPGGSGMYPSQVSPVLTTFGYSSSYHSGFSYSLAANEIIYGRPVLMQGSDPSKQTAHAWVVDGVMQLMHHEGYYYPGTDILYENTISEQYNYTDYYTYVWINWGGGGSPARRQYSYQRVAYLWDIPLQVSTVIFGVSIYSFTNNLMMWTNVKPSGY